LKSENADEVEKVKGALEIMDGLVKLSEDKKFILEEIKKSDLIKRD